jgi:hypothetical protein
MSRYFFLSGPAEIPSTNEAFAYVYRLIDFHDALTSGRWFPQWSVFVRNGLGEPLFGYYQPGFFYLASFWLCFLSPIRALGAAVFSASLAGYAGMYCLVARRFDRLAGAFAATVLLLSVYPATEIFVRGDLSEYAAMMLVPWALHCLWLHLEEGGRKTMAGLALSSGALAFTHACVALPAFMLFGAVIVAHGTATRRWKAAAATTGALGVGLGIASFYTLPVLLEWNLISSKDTFTDWYDYRKHFLSWTSLFSGYTRQTPIPATIGPVLPVLLGISLLFAALQWKTWDSPRRRFFLFLIAASVGSYFMMTQSSAPLWRLVPPLAKLQFPWRLYALASVAMAAWAGAVLPSERSARRLILVAGSVLALSWLSLQATEIPPMVPVDIPQRGQDLVRVDYFPDGHGDWLPRDAKPFPPGQAPTLKVSSPDCRAWDLELAQGSLRFQVQAASGCRVTPPHYFFPAGWRARYQGKPIALERDPDGLMQVAIPAGTTGAVELTFGATPMRRLGLVLTGLSLALAGWWLLY